MAEKENSAFRLRRLVEKMLSQPQNISTAQALLNAIGAGNVKAGREQNALLSRTIDLISKELDSLIPESGRAGFSDQSRKSIVAAIDRLSVLLIGQTWQNHAPTVKASLDPLCIFGEGLPDEGPPISQGDLSTLQKAVSPRAKGEPASRRRPSVERRCALPSWWAMPTALLNVRWLPVRG